MNSSLGSIRCAAAARRFTVYRPQGAVSKHLNASRGGQAKDTSTQQVALRAPPREEAAERSCQSGRRADEHKNAAVISGETILAKEVLVVRDEQEGPWASVDLWILRVSPKTAILLGFPDLTEAR